MSDALKSAALAYEAIWASHPNFVFAEIARSDLTDITDWLIQCETTLVSQIAANHGTTEAAVFDFYRENLTSTDPDTRTRAERRIAELENAAVCGFWDYTTGLWQERDDAVIRLVRTIDLADVAALTTWASFVRARLQLEDAVTIHSRKITEHLDAEEELPD